MKKLCTMLLALVMMFAFASTAMAADAPGLYVNGVKQDVTITDGQSVYDVVKAWAGDRAVWKEVASDIGDGTGMVLVSLDGYASKPYNSTKLDEYDMYTPECGDDTLDEANAVLLKAFPASQGLGLWIGNGTGFGKTGNYGIYVGQDWMFTINGERPNNGQGVDYYMNQAIVDSDDVIELTYGMVYEPFAM